MISSINLSVGVDRYTVECVAVRCGNDVNVTIGGGDKYHIGAVAIGVPRFEYKNDKNDENDENDENDKKRTASTSVICVQGHREDEVAYRAAKYLSTELGCVVTVTAGIHVDNIKSEEFQILLNNIDELLNNIAELLK